MLSCMYCYCKDKFIIFYSIYTMLGLPLKPVKLGFFRNSSGQNIPDLLIYFFTIPPWKKVPPP